MTAHRTLDIASAILGIAMVLAVATVPLDPREQALFAIGTAVVFVVANLKARVATMFLIVLSSAVSLRYIVWRLTDTLDFASPLELTLGFGLVIAECYAIAVLVLGYVQTIWPLDRKPMPLPDDPAVWPTVDVYVPTYHESISVMHASVLAAMAIDWPRDKIKVWILDDGGREEFRLFAQACGCGYIAREYMARERDLHAKAGNLNHALGLTDGAFVCVFDCGQIPTRAFLQMTMGWLVAESNLAMVQTPQHLYSPDPFQRTLTAGMRVPAEGNLFHGLVQDGNDYWNACSLSGSCAVLRRSALAEIDGFATETVTEAAHTMLKLHRRGWDSAYIKLPLAAGLASEQLSRHIGQRIRRTRGMLQILRIDNPLFGRGLSTGQRICYIQATGQFLFAIPRLAFLTAPLAYLLFGQTIICAPPLAIAAYALPHLFHSVATNARLRKHWRHSFWGEVYETVLAPFLVGVTIATLLFPQRGRFNATAKPRAPDSGLDLPAVDPNLILLFLLFAGVARGLIGLIFFSNETQAFQALLLNSTWALFSLLIVLAALAVGRETRQVETRARVRAALPVSVFLADGRALSGITRGLGQSGGDLVVERMDDMAEGAGIEVQFDLGGGPLMVPARVLTKSGGTLQIGWEPGSIEEEARVVQAVFGRADAWTGWADYPDDRPLASLYRVVASIGGLFRRSSGRPERRQVLADPGQPANASSHTALPGQTHSMAGSAAAALLLVVASVSGAHAQSRGRTTVRPVPQPVMTLQGIPDAKFAGLRVAVPTAVPEPATAQRDGLADADRPGTRRIMFNLRQLGAPGPLTLSGTSEIQGVDFATRSDEVVTAASLSLSGAMSPNLIAGLSNITVMLNEQYVGTIPVDHDHPKFQLDLSVDPAFFQDSNRLSFRFSGRYTRDCNDALSGLLWATVNDVSTLTLKLERLPPQRDLARLPLPFLDAHERQLLALPFVLPGGSSNETLRAAGIVASWFGQKAGSRGTHFPVASDPPAEGDAVMMVVGRERRGRDFLPPIDGPMLAVVPNPNDPLGSILVVAGRDGDEAVTAATTLALAYRTLGGATAVVQAPEVAARKPYDAPNWIPTDRPVALGELVAASDLQMHGYVGLLHVPFSTAPDFYTWHDRAFAMNVRFHAPGGPIIDAAPSRLDVGINGRYLHTLSLARDSQSEARVEVPAYDVSGQNELQFAFDARPLHRNDCAAIPNDLRMSVDPDSTIDLRRGHRFASLPNLAFFVNAGFPFTRYADLAETAVVLPERPSPAEIGAYLDVMGRLGGVTGFPAIRAAVVRPDSAASMADRDLLVIGTLQRLQGTANLFRNAPVRLDVHRLDVALPGALDGVRRLFGDRTATDRQRAATLLSAPLTESTALILGSESPLRPGRSVVAVVAAEPQGLDAVLATLRDNKQATLIEGDLAFIGGGRVTSYRVGPTYTVGSLPFWMWPSWALHDQPLAIAIVMLVGCVFCTIALYRAMRRRANGRRSQSSMR